MSIYISSILTASIIGGIISSLLPSREQRMKKHINFIIGLISAIIMITPIVNIASNAATFKDSVDSVINSLDVSTSLNESNQIIVSTSIENICNGIKSTVINKFNFKEDDVTVTAVTDTDDIENIKIVKITIILKNEASWYDENKIKSYIEEIIGCAVEIVRS